jgi:HEAT repeat protein
VQVFLERVADPATSAAALDCLESGSPPPVEILFSCLRSPAVGQRMAAARVLGRLNQAAVSRELIAMVLRGTYRQEAMIALLSSSEATAQQFLAGAARDPTLSATFLNAKRQFQQFFSWRS